jgi:fructokinase
MIAALGEALVDLIQQPDGNFKPCLGGSVFNFCIGAARQGLDTAYLNPLSQDRFGQQFVTQLDKNKVELRAGYTSQLPTALAVVSLDGEGKPTYAFHHGPVADRDIDLQKVINSLPNNISLLHTGGLALIPPDVDKVIAVMPTCGPSPRMISPPTEAASCAPCATRISSKSAMKICII